MLTSAYYLLQVTLCSAVMMGYYWLLLRNKRFHQYNRFFLLAIALLSWLVPLVKIQWNPAAINGDIRVVNLLSAVAQNNSTIEASLGSQWIDWNWETISILLYASVSLFILFGMLRAFYQIYRLLKTYACKKAGDINLVLTRADGTPFSFFKFIFWNEDIELQSESGKRILLHELTHVKQKHSIDHIFLHCILVIGWFNPFFWLLKKEMEMIHEFIADKEAVKDGNIATLAGMLLTATYPQQRFLLTQPFFFSPIKRRLQMLANNHHPRFSYLRRLVVLPLLAIVVVCFAFRNKEGSSQMQSQAFLQKEAMTEKQVQEIKALFRDTTPAKKDTSMKKVPLVLKTKSGEKPLVVIDGVKGKYEELGKIAAKNIESVNILKDASAIKKYGREGRFGVIEITTSKDTFLLRNKVIENEYGKDHQPASFPGGLSAWTKYLYRNLDSNVAKKNGAPPGLYTVNISFLVDKMGGIQNVKGINDPGYGTMEEAIRLLAKGPRWKPAMLEGNQVAEIHAQTIQFKVSE